MLGLLVLTLLASPTQAAPAPTVVRVEAGRLNGAVTDGVLSFKGVPFAAAPVGDLRWRSPQKAAAWKRPDGKKAIFGVSSLGGTSHLWSYYFMEKLGLADKVTWLGVGNVDTMLGTLKTKQIDVLSSAISVVSEAEKNGWGKVIYSPSDAGPWNAIIGGPVPVNVNFCLTATIEKEPEKVQAFTNAMWRSMQFIKKSSPEEILGTIERFVGSSSRNANLLEIGELKDVADWNGLITPESYARGEKVWYSELTGIKQPIKLEDAVADRFLEAAHAKYPT